MIKVAIIGAGPAGIAMGAELVNAGISPEQIAILEKSEKDNASIRQFYPAGKDVNSVYKSIEVPTLGVVGFTGIISVEEFLQKMQDIITEYKLNITYKTEISKVVKKDGGFFLEGADIEAEYVVLASGVFAKPRKPDYKIPPAILKQVSYDILALQKQKVSGLDILVVGGGDTASEYVQMLSEMSNNVTLSYRQDKIFRMNQLNIGRLTALVDDNKVDMCLGTNITSVEPQGDKILVKFQERDDLVVDNVVYSLGGASPSAFMDSCGLDYDDTDVVLREYGETSVDKMFMIGDLASGRKGGSLMLAFNGAKAVVDGLKAKYNI